jgi:hypothetical protein
VEGNVSEYQYYEFVAVDRPLDADELAQVRTLSTRADITSSRFVNEYHWGNFRGSPRAMVESFYDGFLYLANWGTRELMFRLPTGVLKPATARKYCLTDSAKSWSKNGNTIIHLYREGDGDDEFDDDPHGLLGSIISVRSELAAGDHRLLYLAWLHSVAEGELDDDVMEPPVPANLGALSAGLRSVVDFIRLDRDLLDVAVKGSTRETTAAPSAATLQAWVAGLPAAEKDALIVKMMRGHAHIGAQLVRRFRDGAGPKDQHEDRRTVADLLDAAQNLREHRARVAAEERERRRRQHERDVATAFQRRLDALAADPEAAWAQVNTLIEAKKAREYDAAVALLTELSALARRDGDLDRFRKRANELATTYAGRPALLERLRRAGLPTG